MKNVPVVTRTLLIITVLAFMCACGITGCDSEFESYDCGDEPCFAIYLVDSGELVLSERHIKAYRRGVQFFEDDTHELELNEEGIEKWNSYMTFGIIPKLVDSLCYRDFVLKIEGEEIYRGQFYSMVSSTGYGGVVILDAMITLNDDHSSLWISYGYAWPELDPEEDPRNSPEVIDFLDATGLLE